MPHRAEHLDDFGKVLEAMSGNCVIVKADPPKYSIIAATDEFVDMVGMSRAQLYGNGMIEMLPNRTVLDDSRGEISLLKSLDELVCSKKEHQWVVQNNNLDKYEKSLTKKYWRTTNKPVINNSGEVVFIIHEVSAFEEANSEQLEKKIFIGAQAYELFMQTPMAICIVKGEDFIIELANELMLKVLGKDPELVGKPILEALPEATNTAFAESLSEVLRSGKSIQDNEHHAFFSKGEIEELAYYSFMFQPYFEDDDTVASGVFIVAYDVTDQVLAQRKLLENEANLQGLIEKRTLALERKYEELEHTNEKLKQFAYVASHDLQEPLRKIRTFSDLMSHSVEPEAPIRKYVDKINSSAVRMSGLINSLLEYSNLSKGAQRFEKVDLNDILNNILSDYELLINQKNATILIDTLPTIQAIPLQINQLFYNLIGNALKFTKRNVQPLIQINAELLSDNERGSFKLLDSNKDYFKFIIQDNGIGFEQNYADKIFTIFQQLNDKTAFGGYGIGLALCKKVTDSHKGTIVAEGKLKEGAKFTVVLPVKH